MVKYVHLFYWNYTPTTRGFHKRLPKKLDSDVLCVGVETNTYKKNLSPWTFQLSWYQLAESSSLPSNFSC